MYEPFNLMDSHLSILVLIFWADFHSENPCFHLDLEALFLFSCSLRKVSGLTLRSWVYFCYFCSNLGLEAWIWFYTGPHFVEAFPLLMYVLDFFQESDDCNYWICFGIVHFILWNICLLCSGLMVFLLIQLWNLVSRQGTSRIAVYFSGLLRLFWIIVFPYELEDSFSVNVKNAITILIFISYFCHHGTFIRLCRSTKKDIFPPSTVSFNFFLYWFIT